MAYTGPFFVPQIVLLQSQTASNSASIVFSSTYITSTYTTYKVIYYGIYPDTDATAFNLDLSTDNGATYLNSNFLAGDLVNQYNSATLANTNSTTTLPIITGQSNNTANAPICGMMDLYNLPTAVDACVVAHSSYFLSGSSFAQSIFAGTNTAAGSINAIRFSFSAGNIASGTISLYGVKQ